MKNKKTANIILIALCSLLLFIAAAFAAVPRSEAMADSDAQTYEAQESEPQPRLWTVLSLSIGGGNGTVYATAKNDFTLFMSTVPVTVELYSSSTYTTDYTQMTLEAVVSTNDLDMNTSITATAETGGVTKYWLGRMLYKIDSDVWQTRETGVRQFSGTGELL